MDEKVRNLDESYVSNAELLDIIHKLGNCCLDEDTGSLRELALSVGILALTKIKGRIEASP